jgi:hypothetical protein
MLDADGAARAVRERLPILEGRWRHRLTMSRGERRGMLRNPIRTRCVLAPFRSNSPAY